MNFAYGSILGPRIDTDETPDIPTAPPPDGLEFDDLEIRIPGSSDPEVEFEGSNDNCLEKPSQLFAKAFTFLTDAH